MRVHGIAPISDELASTPFRSTRVNNRPIARRAAWQHSRSAPNSRDGVRRDPAKPATHSTDSQPTEAA